MQFLRSTNVRFRLFGYLTALVSKCWVATDLIPSLKLLLSLTSVIVRENPLLTLQCNLKTYFSLRMKENVSKSTSLTQLLSISWSKATQRRFSWLIEDCLTYQSGICTANLFDSFFTVGANMDQYLHWSFCEGDFCNWCLFLLPLRKNRYRWKTSAN